MFQLFSKKSDIYFWVSLSNSAFCIVYILVRICYTKKINKIGLNKSGIFLIALLIISILSTAAVHIKINYESNLVETAAMTFLNIAVMWIYGQIETGCAKEREIYLLHKNIKQYEKQLKFMAESIKKISSLRHDIQNHIIVITRLLYDEKLEEAVSYLKQLGAVYELSEEYARSGNYCIDSIINHYMAEAKILGAEVELILKVPESIQVNSLDICVIIGNLLQNTIEALQNCASEKELYILLVLERGLLRISIRNTYSALPTIYRIKGKKSKEYIHGFGLEYVKETINKYNGRMEVNAKDGIFEVNAFIITE